MDEKTFTELQLRTIAPGQSKWPDDALHWQRLHGAANAARDVVAATWRAIAEINSDRDLTPEAKAKRAAIAAAEGVDALQNHTALIRARETAKDVIARHQKRIEETCRAPQGEAEIAMAAEIRSYVRGIEKDRLAWLSQHADEVALSAVIHAPAYLSGLSDVEMAAAKRLAEKRADPELIESRDAIARALEDVERGFAAAKAKIASKVQAAAA